MFDSFSQKCVPSGDTFEHVDYICVRDVANSHPLLTDVASSSQRISFDGAIYGSNWVGVPGRGVANQQENVGLMINHGPELSKLGKLAFKTIS